MQTLTATGVDKDIYFVFTRSMDQSSPGLAQFAVTGSITGPNAVAGWEWLDDVTGKLSVSDLVTNAETWSLDYTAGFDPLQSDPGAIPVADFTGREVVI